MEERLKFEGAETVLSTEFRQQLKGLRASLRI